MDSRILYRMVLIAATLVLATKGKHSESYKKIYRDDSPSVKQLLQEIVPNGELPVLPDGFPTLDKLKAEKFDYVVKNGNVTATIDLEDPVSLLGEGMKVRDVTMTFVYNKKGTSKGHWEFNAQGKWRHGNMLARVKIEESKVGKHHTLVAAADRLNVYDIASSISEKQSIESAGMNLAVLKNLTVTNVEMYSVFKGDNDYVFMISGKPEIDGTKAETCKVFVRRLPDKKGVFSVLLEFKKDLPSRVLLKLISDDLFKIPFVNHLIAQTRLFRTSETDFGFVASTGEVDKLPLKSFGGGILSTELDSRISKGLTLLLPIHLGNENQNPVRVAVEIDPPLVKFLTGKHEKVSVSQTLAALSPKTPVSVLPYGFPDLAKVSINKFSYNIEQETFLVYSHIAEEFTAIPQLMNVSNMDVVFKHNVGDQIDTWTIEGEGLSNLGGNVAKVSLSTEEEEAKIIVFKGSSKKMSVLQLAKQYGLSFVPDEESRAIVESSKMNDFLFTNPTIKSAFSINQKKRFIHVSGKGHFPGVKKLTEAEVVVYEESGKLKTAVGFVFPKIPLNSLIDALTGFDTTNLKMLKNSYNASLVLSPQEDRSFFENPTLSGLSLSRGMSLVGLFRIPEDCEGLKLCESVQSLLESDEWYRIQGLIKHDGFSLTGSIKRNYALGESLMLTDNTLDFTIGQDSSFVVHSRMTLPKEKLSFTGSLNFAEDNVILDMESDDTLHRTFKGGLIRLDNLAISTPILKLLPLKDLRITGRMNLGSIESKTLMSADAVVTYQPTVPEVSRFEAKFEHQRIEELISALEMTNVSIPRVLSNADFPEGFMAIYDPTIDNTTNFFITGQMHIFDKDFDAIMKMKDSKTLLIDTDNTKSPYVISEGNVILQKDLEKSTGGPKLHIEVTPRQTKVKLIGYAKAFGISKAVNIDVTDDGTGFPIYGKLFDVSGVGILISSNDVLSSSETAEFLAYGCLESIKKDVTLETQRILKDAAHEADTFIAQAQDNLKEAKTYYRKATVDETTYRDKLEKQKALFRKREKEVWKAEEKYNSSCQLGHCKKKCIGCPDWNRCCSRDVFGNCVECPAWNKCCYTTGDPVCVAKNHGCQHIRKVAEGNYEDAKDILKDQKKRLDHVTKNLFDAEFSKGKTKAVLDAAGKALSLIDRDSVTGIRASKAIKDFGLEKLFDIKSICFKEPLESLASSCINMQVNLTMMGSTDEKSYPLKTCLNKDLLPSVARFVANIMFPDVNGVRHRRSLLSEEREPGVNFEAQDAEFELETSHRRSRRSVDEEKERSHERIEPFWDLIREHNPLQDEAKPIPNHPAMGKATLKRKWKIPASEKGRCKIYHQLLNICRDMMKTVKKMYSTYMYERYMFAKEKDNFRRRLRRVTKQLETSAKLVSGTEDQMVKIERSLNFLSVGVRKWMDKSSKAIERQDIISVKAWVKGMDARIQSLGGEGVNRFLSNLFKAFYGLFESGNIPDKKTGKALSVVQRINHMKKAFNQIFKKDIPLGRANYYADRVLYDITEIKGIGVYCKK